MAILSVADVHICDDADNLQSVAGVTSTITIGTCQDWSQQGKGGEVAMFNLFPGCLRSRYATR